MRRVAIVAALVLGVGSLPPHTAVGAPAVITVDTFADGYDGSCADGDCSVRDALARVADGGTVKLPSGFYTLSVTGAGGLEEGDLDLTRSVTITRSAEGGVFLDASGLGDRIAQIDGDAGVTLEGLTLLGGHGNIRGGGVRVVTGSVALLGVTIVGGSVGEGGGGLSVAKGGAATVARSLFLDNRTRGTGGGIEVAGTAEIVDSTIAGNTARVGGGIDVRDADVVLENVTIAKNRARGSGGGIRASGSVLLGSATVARNRAGVAGGGVASSPDVVRFARSVVADNVAPVGASCTSPGVSAGHNVEDTTSWCGFSRSTDIGRVDARLGGLRANGGPTPAIALLNGSPALGAGGTGCPHADQRGAPRGVPCDSGAYERVLCLGSVVNIVGTRGDDELSGGREPDTFLGLGGDDEFQGSLAADRACGGPGDDHLIGGPGDDILAGQLGGDLLEGEDGDDRLLGGPGADACDGGPGRDRTLACEPDG